MWTQCTLSKTRFSFQPGITRKHLVCIARSGGDWALWPPRNEVEVELGNGACRQKCMSTAALQTKSWRPMRASRDVLACVGIKAVARSTWQHHVLPVFEVDASTLEPFFFTQQCAVRLYHDDHHVLLVRPHLSVQWHTIPRPFLSSHPAIRVPSRIFPSLPSKTMAHSCSFPAAKTGTRCCANGRVTG